MGRHAIKNEHTEINRLWDDHLTPTEVIDTVNDGYRPPGHRWHLSDVEARTEAFTMVDLPAQQPVRYDPQDVKVAPLGRRQRAEMAVAVYRQGRHRHRQSRLSWAIGELQRHPRRLVIIVGASLAIGATLGFSQVAASDVPAVVAVPHQTKVKHHTPKKPPAVSARVVVHPRHQTVRVTPAPHPTVVVTPTIRVPAPRPTAHRPTPRPTHTITPTPRPSPTKVTVPPVSHAPTSAASPGTPTPSP